MLTRKYGHVVLALALALAAASPAAAKQRAQHPGYAARAEAIGGGLTDRAVNRMQALRDCNDKSAVFRDYTWGIQQYDRYRACMAGHGQPE